MTNNRRNFLKISGLLGVNFLTPNITKAVSSDLNAHSVTNGLIGTQQFNMSGYAAPKLDVVRIGQIGLGNRGILAVNRLKRIAGVKINGLCDIRHEKTDAAQKNLENTLHKPVIYNKSAEDWKKICERDDIDLVYIATPWELHTPMAVYAMNHGKHVCVEVPAARTIDECWQLVETSEKNKKHCMMLENCCYDFFELLTLNMARQGLFGEIIHGEGAYLHNLLDGNFSKKKYYNLWRLKENFQRKGNLYPTHGLGPVCQVMNINRGDRMDYLVSVSSNDFMMEKEAERLAAQDAFYKPYVNKNYNGNMNTSTIRTLKGKTILVQHDVTSPQPYSRIHMISGTKGTALKYPEPGRIALGHEWLEEKELKELVQQYTPPLVKRIGEMAKEVGGHGGMDFIMDWRTIDCLRNGLPLDQNVYDAALWSSIAPLSAQSLSNRSNSVDVPDFTRGAWKTNQPVDISLSTGGNTKVI